MQASRLITVKQSRQLISKLETLASPFEAKQLNRQVYVSDRNKTDNETIYETIDRLHESMQKNRQVWNGRQMAKRSADIVEHFMKSVRIF